MATTKAAASESIERRKPGRPKKPASYPALLITQNRHRFYFTTIPVDDLFQYCFVARRDEDPKIGFQRALTEPRADDIARYLADGAGSIPSNVVLSAQPSAGFAYDRRTKSVSFGRSSKAFLVLDGQHRLWGYSKCSARHRVPVANLRGVVASRRGKTLHRYQYNPAWRACCIAAGYQRTCRGRKHEGAHSQSLV